jgi:hypothetical protein
LGLQLVTENMTDKEIKTVRTQNVVKYVFAWNGEEGIHYFMKKYKKMELYANTITEDWLKDFYDHYMERYGTYDKKLSLLEILN